MASEKVLHLFDGKNNSFRIVDGEMTVLERLVSAEGQPEKWRYEVTKNWGPALLREILRLSAALAEAEERARRARVEGMRMGMMGSLGLIRNRRVDMCSECRDDAVHALYEAIEKHDAAAEREVAGEPECGGAQNDA